MPDNMYMGDKTRQIMSMRLTYLMGVTPSLDTNEKLAAKSGVSYGTVRRVRKAEPTDVQIGHVEAIAGCFGLNCIVRLASGWRNAYESYIVIR